MSQNQTPVPRSSGVQPDLDLLVRHRGRIDTQLEPRDWNNGRSSALGDRAVIARLNRGIYIFEGAVLVVENVVESMCLFFSFLFSFSM
jgi:hypothetical protein